MRIDEKHIVLIGVGGGIGAELARALAGRGCRLTIGTRHPERLSMLPAATTTLIRGDVRDPAILTDLDRVLSPPQTPPIDGLIYCAGVSRADSIDAPDAARAIDTLRINLEGAVAAIYHFLPRLRQRPSSIVAAFGSMAGDRGVPAGHAYCAAKSGLERFLDCLRIDLWDSPVRVFTISPGYITSPMTAQNEFPMPGIWPVERAVARILAGLAHNEYVMRFPPVHALGMRLTNMLPNRFYWWLMSKVRHLARIRRHPDDDFGAGGGASGESNGEC